MSRKIEDPIKAAVLEALRQGECLLEALSDETYIRSLPDAFDASVGGHYRHCLEHFEALFTSGTAAAREVDYDARKRDPQVEKNRLQALARTRALAGQFETLVDSETLAAPVNARCRISYVEADSPVAASSLGREAMYAVVHAIHHYAIISLMCRLMQVRLPDGFGVAPSTAKHRTEQAAAANPHGQARQSPRAQG